MKENFYLMGGAYKRGAIKIQANEIYDTLSILDDSSILKIKNKFDIDEGKKEYDLIQFSDSVFFAISPRFKELLEKNKVSGWDSFEISINNLNNNFYAFYVKSKAGRILNIDALNNYETESIEFDISTWDGSDFFYLEDTLLYVCTERVKNIIEENKLTNIEFKPL